MSGTNGNLAISRDLLEILRDPLAVQEPEKYGPDPGQLELVRDYWLVSKDTGLKYPIRDGIPVMLIDEGLKWKDTAVSELPVPPPEDKPAAATSEVASSIESRPASSKIPIIGAVVAAAIGITLVAARLFSGRKKGQTEE